MERRDRNSAIAAAIILAVFGFGAYFMPSVMGALGEISPFLAGLAAVLFVAAFFLLFWLRGRWGGGRGGEGTR